MKKESKRNFSITLAWFIGFVIWTFAIKNLDVQSIGPKNSVVGFATMNGAFHELTGVHMQIYTITDLLGVVPFAIVLGFAVFGLLQLMKRRSLYKVDSDIMILGGFYIAVFAAYGMFEIFPINFRPVLIEGVLEASYPSSTTLLVLSVMPTAIMQANDRIKNSKMRKMVAVVISLFMVFMVIGRLVSGVHWITDIIGGILLSVALVMLYHSFVVMVKRK